MKVMEKPAVERNVKSRELWQRSCNVIVGGGQAHKRPVDIMQLGGPAFAARASGSRMWDVDGNEYIDFLLAYGPIVLGHSHPAVNEAVRRQMEDGTVYSIEHPLEIELAEKLVEIIPSAEMVAFFTGGTSTTTGAVRMARAHTGREKIIRCGYHGWTDWTHPDSAGVPKVNQELSLSVPYNDLDALEQTLKDNAGQVAGVVIESIQGDGPADGYFPGVRRLADEHGAVFILDEVKTGFRFDLGGAQARWNIEPDLSCFGKAMCNGYPGSAVVGKRSIMASRTDTWVAATFHGDLLSTVAALATIRELEQNDGCGYFWRLGRRLLDGLNDVFEQNGLPYRATGFPPMPNVKCTEKDVDGVKCFCAAMQRRGIYVTGHPWFLSLSHAEADVDQALNAAADGADEIKQMLAQAKAQARKQ